jgi:hypothetical protein
VKTPDKEDTLLPLEQHKKYIKGVGILLDLVTQSKNYMLKSFKVSATASDGASIGHWMTVLPLK